MKCDKIRGDASTLLLTLEEPSLPLDYARISASHDYEAMLVNVTRKIIVPLYEDPTHFIFELLQNAEDALGKRVGKGSRTVNFELTSAGLRASHYGRPFDESNVRAICSVGDSSKDEDITAIGKFGIGFKSVYSLTNRPEIHSGDEHFAIENFVHPVPVEPIELDVGETVFWFPFRHDVGDTWARIRSALEDLPPSTLLFLRHILEVRWSIENGDSGSFARTSKNVGNSIQRSTLKQFRNGERQSPESWLVCSSPVFFKDAPKGTVELAFQVHGSSAEFVVKPLAGSRVVAYFPTIVESKLGFLIQAPFQTTPSRESIPADQLWNQYLVNELSKLLADSLVRLRDLGVLSIELLSTLPINRNDFPSGSLFAPLYDATFSAIRTKSLLPTADGKWTTAQNALIARGDELRKLLRPKQLAAMFGTTSNAKWLSERLTQIRFPSLYRYLLSSQSVPEISPSDCIPKWTKEFLESQPESWVIELCAFLLTQPALMREASFKNKPWVRMEDGSHRAPFLGDQPQAFLPAQVGVSGFPTVRNSLLRSKEAVEFYARLGLTEPDPVDDVIAHVLPRYAGERVQSDLLTYAKDIERLAAAAKTDSTKQLDKLTSAARDKKLVRAVDGLGQSFWTVPSNAYFSSASLKALFRGVKGVLLVDDEQACLKGDSVRGLLRRLGASTYLDTFTVDVLPSDERYMLRGGKGTGRGTSDRDIRGLEEVLALVPELPPEQAAERCRVLWDALRDLVRDSRENVLYGTYHWSHYGDKSAPFTACFVRRLQKAKWIPYEDGKLVTPTDAVFERIPGCWTENAALQKALGFKPPVMELLAKEMGVEAEMLNLLLKRGIKTKAQLEECLTEEPSATGDQISGNPNESSKGSPLGADNNGSTKVASGSSQAIGSGGGKRSQAGGSASSGLNSSTWDLGPSATNSIQTGRTEFVSYLATRPTDEDEEEVTDAQTKLEKMRVEAEAIKHILKLEPDLRPTPPGNKGFDLYGVDESEQSNRWVEVKALKNSLGAVGMSKAQFKMAQEKGFRYWLYIVEQSTSHEPRILKIQDPAGNARTFIFDKGWRDIAIVSQVNVDTGEVKEDCSGCP